MISEGPFQLKWLYESIDSYSEYISFSNYLFILKQRCLPQVAKNFALFFLRFLKYERIFSFLGISKCS